MINIYKDEFHVNIDSVSSQCREHSRVKIKNKKMNAKNRKNIKNSRKRIKKTISSNLPFTTRYCFIYVQN